MGVHHADWKCWLILFLAFAELNLTSFIWLFTSAVRTNCPKAWLPSYIQGSASYTTFISSECCCCFFLLISWVLDTIACGDNQDFKIQNIVASCDVKFPIRLEGLAYSHGAFSSVSWLFNNSNASSVLYKQLSFSSAYNLEFFVQIYRFTISYSHIGPWSALLVPIMFCSHFSPGFVECTR